mmetsp:Transcript_6596/g.18690  ORF Transcript_6596/g.18690 Transcript_6596/m.18690 type:complete len:823 (+) Transcript_6596:60-2528(+)
MWLLHRGLAALDEEAPDTIHLLGETVEPLPAGVVMPLQRDHDIAYRVRQLRLTFFFREDADGPAGSLAVTELPSAYNPRGAPFLARQRVPLGGSPFPSGRHGEVLPQWHRIVPPPEFRASAAAAPAGRIQPTRTPAEKLSNRLHWPSLDEEQFVTAEDLVPGSTLRVLGRTIRILDCDDEYPQTQAWMLRRRLLSADFQPLPATPDPYTEVRIAVVEDAERAAQRLAQLSADNDELRRRRYIEMAARPALRDNAHRSGRGVMPLPNEASRHAQRGHLQGLRMRFKLEWVQPVFARPASLQPYGAELVGAHLTQATVSTYRGSIRESTNATVVAPWDRPTESSRPRNEPAPPSTDHRTLRSRRERAAANEIAPRPGELPTKSAFQTGLSEAQSTSARTFILTYFCEDDTASVVEELPLNSGDEFGGRLCSRQQIPKRPDALRETGPTFHNVASSAITTKPSASANSLRPSTGALANGDKGDGGMEGDGPHSSELYIRPNDLRVGEYVGVLGRRMLVVACDSDTREIALQLYGIHMGDNLSEFNRRAAGAGALSDVGAQPTIRSKPRAAWADDGPIAPGKTSSDVRVTNRAFYEKERERDAQELPPGGCICFDAILAESSHQKADGKVCSIGVGRGESLIQQFKLMYDVVERRISARALACAGHTAGLVVRNTCFSNEGELKLGGEIRVNGFNFLLTGADEASLGYMEKRLDRFPSADPRRALAFVRNAVGRDEEAKLTLRDTLANAMVRSREADDSAGGRLDQQQFVDAMQSWPGVHMGMHAATALFRSMARKNLSHRETRGDGKWLLDAPLFLAIVSGDIDT